MPAISAENYSFLQRYIHEQSGIVVEPGKEYLLEARLTPLLNQQSVKTINDLCALLRATSSRDLRRQVVEAMTTHETLFFRDISLYEAILRSILPRLKAEKPFGRKIRVWSAAASSGQEAYSLAILALEAGFQASEIEILGTDLSEQILERARQGRYLQIEVNRGMPAPVLVKYFLRQGLDWQIKDEVRKLVRFEQFDLREPMRALGYFDLILCRNVLIYFDMETKKRIVQSLAGQLHPGGLITLGGAESILTLNVSLNRVMVENGVFYEVAK